MPTRPQRYLVDRPSPHRRYRASAPPAGPVTETTFHLGGNLDRRTRAERGTVYTGGAMRYSPHIQLGIRAVAAGLAMLLAVLCAGRIVGGAVMSWLF